MKKADRMAAFVAELEVAHETLDPCYLGFFQCFNQQRYYEAHDVLEHLWLQRRDENYAFFKGLIQFAGAFVHLQKQFLRPHHAKDGRRLRPAVRLLHLAGANLENFRPRRWHLDVEALCHSCAALAAQITASDFQQNPWSPEKAPQLALD